MSDEADTTDRTCCPALELLATAYHEAGHAVVDFAVWPPNPVIRVTIVPTIEYAGLVELGERVEAWRSGLPDGLAEAYLAEAKVVTDLCGRAAVDTFLGADDSLPPLDEVDREHASCSALRTWDGVDGEWLGPHAYLGRARDVLARPEVRSAIPRVPQRYFGAAP